MEKNECFSFLQITDSHLFSEEKKMFGINCNQNFLNVVEKIKTNNEHFAFILATGDIAQDESAEAYQLFRETLDSFAAPIYWIPGNHDDPNKMQKTFQQSPYFSRQRKLTVGQWDFIFVDTKINGKDTGFISNEELYSLESRLSESQQKAIAIVMHHHPIPVQTPLIDSYILENRADFLAIINQYKNVKLVICGHVHGDYTIAADNLTLESAPATCLQWKKGAENLVIDNRIGYKIYQFDRTNYTAQGKLWDFN